MKAAKVRTWLIIVHEHFRDEDRAFLRRVFAANYFPQELRAIN
jgi:hypothetical protein